MFCATYADGVADIDLEALLDFHRAHGALATMTVVRPELQFGVTELDGEEPGHRVQGEAAAAWITGSNGGLLPASRPARSTTSPPAETLLGGARAGAAGVGLARDGQLRAHRHEGFWECMADTGYKDAVARSTTSGPLGRRPGRYGTPPARTAAAMGPALRRRPGRRARGIASRARAAARQPPLAGVRPKR